MLCSIARRLVRSRRGAAAWLRSASRRARAGEMLDSSSSTSLACRAPPRDDHEVVEASGGTSRLPRIGLHDARHTAARMLLRAGVPVKVVAQRLGHADVAVTMRVYQHVTAQDDRIWPRMCSVELSASSNSVWATACTPPGTGVAHVRAGDDVLHHCCRLRVARVVPDHQRRLPRTEAPAKKARPRRAATPPPSPPVSDGGGRGVAQRSYGGPH